MRIPKTSRECGPVLYLGCKLPAVFESTFLQMTIYIGFQRAQQTWILALLMAAGAAGQTVSPQETGSMSARRVGGLQLYNVTAWAGYYSTATLSSFSSTRLPSDVTFGTSATLGWVRARERSSASFNYASSFIGRVRFRGAEALNHALSFFASRKITPRWTFDLSMSGTLNTTDQFLFAPTAFGQLAQAPVSFDELAAGMLRGQFANPQLAALLTGGSLLESTARVAVFGDRVAGGSAQIRMAYALSTRTSFYVSAGGYRSQTFPDTGRAQTRPAGVLNQSTSVEVSADWNHTLTSRTTVGLNVSRSRTFSAFQDAYRDSFSGSLGRRMGRRWLTQVYGGAGRVQSIRNLYALPTGPQYLAGGSLAYMRSTHTFIASVDRNFSDSYGLGGQSSISITGAWSWSPRGRNWVLFSSVGQHRMLGSALGDLNSWRTSAGLSRRINARTAVYTEYAYFTSTSSSTFRWFPNFSQHAARVAIVWSPQWSPLR
jgi:hypothetical protein